MVENKLHLLLMTSLVNVMLFLKILILKKLLELEMN